MNLKIPTQMQAIEISTPGAPEVLRPVTLPLPVPKVDEVLIKVAAAGVNRPDILQRLGRYPVPPTASPLPGLEVAGTIVALGSGVTSWKVGDSVCALTPGGGYAEYCVTAASSCLPIPKGLNAIEAASFPETFFTVWSNVFDRAGLKGNETLLVHGGSSGIGISAIQIAHARGHRVFVTAGSAEKCAACEKLGAERAINYKTEDFVEVVKAVTDQKGVDVILDMVGGDYVARDVKALATDGRLAFISSLGGPQANFNITELMHKRITMSGSALRPRTNEFKADIARSLHKEVWPLIETGKVKPVIHQTFPLTDAAKAHVLMESSAHIGKIVLTVAAS